MIIIMLRQHVHYTRLLIWWHVSEHLQQQQPHNASETTIRPKHM